jgi:FAD:protein FMN transferase
MTEKPAASRRDFLTGRAVRDEALRAQEELAEAMLGKDEDTGVPSARDTIRLETRAMACSWSVVMNPGPPRQVMIASDALDLVHQAESQLTVYRDNSAMSHINATAAETPVVVEPELFALLKRCCDLAIETGGAFDPVTRNLILLWRRCREAGRVPETYEIDESLHCCGTDRVTFDEAGLRMSFDRPGVGFDLGAIGKGVAIDRAAEHLAQQGIADFILHGGHSSMCARGDHYGQGGWPVGIRNPLFTDRRLATLLLRDCSISTSGSNIQFFRHGGRRYGHILDPRTGWPADDVLSVTVVAPNAADADALSTAFYVMGLENALKWCDNRPDIGVLIVPRPAGRRLGPVIHNIPDEALFLHDEDLDMSPRPERSDAD